MHAAESGGSVSCMPLWLLAIVIFTVVFVVGTIAIVVAAVRLIRREPD